jgi:hypothetical protein
MLPELFQSVNLQPALQTEIIKLSPKGFHSNKISCREWKRREKEKLPFHWLYQFPFKKSWFS